MIFEMHTYEFIHTDKLMGTAIKGLSEVTPSSKKTF